jgi:hypothetical protein
MPDAIHPAPNEFSQAQLSDDPILRYFHYAHLPAVLQAVSSPFASLAAMIVIELPRNAERSVALRKLLEAKDAAVRANVPVIGAAVKPAETFLDRLYAERQELGVKLEKLQAFSTTPAFDGLDEDNRDLLRQQMSAMQIYMVVLDKRINTLSPEPPIKAPVPAELSEPDEDGIVDIRVTGGGSVETPLPFGEA